MTDILADNPPSTKLVYKVLEYNGALTQQQIAEESRLSKRTVRDALTRLRDHDIVSKQIYIPDARQNIYQINNPICSDARVEQ